MVIMLVLSAWSFKFIPKVFVPALDKQYFTLDMWLPEGRRIEETDKMVIRNGKVYVVVTNGTQKNLNIG